MSMDPNQRRLKLARAEIEATCRKYDVASHVILHRPGWSEHFANYSPSYSKLKLEGASFLRIRSKLEDYGGDVEAQRRDMEDTTNLVVHFEECLRTNAAAMAHVLSLLRTKFEIVGTAGRFEPDVPSSDGVH